MDQNRRSPVAEATIMPTVPSQPTHCKIKLHYVDVSMAIVSSELRTLVPSTVIEKDYTVEKIREREIEHSGKIITTFCKIGAVVVRLSW